MTSRRTLLVIASVLVAALGTALIWLYVQGVETRARTEAQSSVELKPVLVVTKPADAGTAVSDLTIVPQLVPVALVLDAYVPEGEKPTGRLASPVGAGTILRPSLFTSGVVSGLSNPNNQAASITITAPVRVPALLKKGDDVAVYSYGDRDPNPRLVLKHATVRAVGPDQNAAGVATSGGVDPSIVTFEGPPADMYKILQITTSGHSAAIVINGGATTQPVG